MNDVAVIGIGNIGASMALRLHSAGFDLTVCDVNPRQLERFGKLGVKTTMDAKDCAAITNVLIVVLSEQQLSGVVTELDRAPSSRLQNLAVMSTVPIDAVKAVSERLGAKGIRVVDAPVSGGAKRAEDGDLTIMAGGTSADIDAMRPIFDALASHVFHCGPVGSGQLVKILNNIVCHANQTLMAEVLNLGMEHGLTLDDVLPVMEVSTGRNSLTADRGKATQLFAGVASDRATFSGILRLLQKDMHIASALASSAKGRYPSIHALSKTIDALNDEAFDNWNSIAKLNDVKSG